MNRRKFSFDFVNMGLFAAPEKKRGFMSGERKANAGNQSGRKASDREPMAQAARNPLQTFCFLRQEWAGVGPDFVALLVEEESCLEASSVKSFEVSSCRCNNSGNSLNASPPNNNTATMAKRSLRIGRPENITLGLYSLHPPNSTVLGFAISTFGLTRWLRCLR